MNADFHDRDHLPAGTPVEVFVDFSARWVAGFEVADIGDSGLWLRRDSDGQILPGELTREVVRRATNRSTQS
jgi:hypothetical protein